MRSPAPQEHCSSKSPFSFQPHHFPLLNMVNVLINKPCCHFLDLKKDVSLDSALRCHVHTNSTLPFTAKKLSLLLNSNSSFHPFSAGSLGPYHSRKMALVTVTCDTHAVKSCARFLDLTYQQHLTQPITTSCLKYFHLVSSRIRQFPDFPHQSLAAPF